MNKKYYDIIIIGAGPAGLFTGCAVSGSKKVLILEKNPVPGKKLLLTGSGQCNFTNSADIKKFIGHYNTKKVRKILYSFSNKDLVSFFEQKGISTTVRDDGKIFPRSKDGRDILNILVKTVNEKGHRILTSQHVKDIIKISGLFEIRTDSDVFSCRKLVIAAGGCSYPKTGSDGEILNFLEKKGIHVIKPKPALSPLYIKDYPYSGISGVSIKNVEISSNNKKCSKQGDILFTYKSLSGPAALNISGYVDSRDEISVNFLFPKKKEVLLKELQKEESSKSIKNIICSMTDLPESFVSEHLKSNGIEPQKKIKETSLKKVSGIFTEMVYKINHEAKFDEAMATRGGIDLEEINTRDMSHISDENLFFVGEIIDADGDTGGFNLQFAFSTGWLCGKML